jgi:hypothetical protein
MGASGRIAALEVLKTQKAKTMGGRRGKAVA